MHSTPTARSIVERAIEIVQSNPCDMQSSVDINITDALHSLNRGFPVAAMHSARRACSYSVGVFHPEYVALSDDIVEILDEMDAGDAAS